MNEYAGETSPGWLETSYIQSGQRRASYYYCKRAVDIVGSVLLFLVSAPVLVLTAVLIKLWDRGPILHWQTRVGQKGIEFDFPKFRSMHVDAEHMREHLEDQNHHTDGVTFKMRNDPRVTPIGRFIRKTSLDEFPQLWCVLTGQMSLVGPRPPLPTEVALYQGEDFRRLDGIPGLTCYWQVMGRADLPFSEQVRLDLQYLRECSLGTDLRILMRTIPVVLLGKGAY